MKGGYTRKTLQPKRLFSLWVLISFIATNHFSLPLLAAVSVDQTSKKFSAEDLSAIRIPGEIGKVQEFHKASGKETIILVQDAHAIPDAQRSIQKIITHFQTQYGVNLIALEGASQELDAQIFKSFPDKEILKQTFEEYLDRGELPGSMAAAIFDETPSIYRGIEDWSLYEEGLILYLNGLKKEKGLLEKVDSFQSELQKQKEQTYSKNLLDLDQVLTEFRVNQGSLLEVLKKLAAIKKPETGTELALLVDEIEKDGASQFSVESEVKKLAQSIQTSLRKEELFAFNRKLQAFQTSGITPEAFALFLKELSIKFSDHLSYLVQNQKRMKEIEGTKLFKDFEAYVESVKASLFRNGDERALDQKSQELELLERLSRFELSREDWNQLNQITSPHYFRKILEDLKFHVSFYQNAEKRDQALFRNLTGSM